MSSPKCATCPRQLSPTDLKQRCLRCKPCRLAKKVSPASRFTINPQREAERERSIGVKPPPASDSWWMKEGLSREEFQVEAQRRSDVKMGKIAKVPISISPTGVTV